MYTYKYLAGQLSQICYSINWYDPFTLYPIYCRRHGRYYKSDRSIRLITIKVLVMLVTVEVKNRVTVLFALSQEQTRAKYATRDDASLSPLYTVV